MTWCVSDFCCDCNSRHCTCEADEAASVAECAKTDIKNIEEVRACLTSELSGDDQKEVEAAFDNLISILSRYTAE